MKRALLLVASLLAFQSFGSGFLLDAAKLALGVTKCAFDGIRGCWGPSEEEIPKLVSVSPADGMKDVDPNLGEIVVCFDRPMGGGWSLTGDGWPKIVGSP